MAYQVYYFCYTCQDRKEPLRDMTCPNCKKSLREICENCGQPTHSDDGDGCACDQKTDNLELG